MNSSNYDFRKFQEELAALDAKSPSKPVLATPVSKKAAAVDRMTEARNEFLMLRQRYGLTVADVVSFFPEEEGIGFLQGLIAASDGKHRRVGKSKIQG